VLVQGRLSSGCDRTAWRAARLGDHPAGRVVTPLPRQGVRPLRRHPDRSGNAFGRATGCHPIDGSAQRLLYLLEGGTVAQAPGDIDALTSGT